MEDINSNTSFLLEYIIPIIAIMIAYIAIRMVRNSRLSRFEDSLSRSQDKQKF
jgi:hypothetical protein